MRRSTTLALLPADPRAVDRIRYGRIRQGTSKIGGFTRSVAVLTALVVAPLLAPAAANASHKSGVSFQNTFENRSERDAWTMHNGDLGGFIGFSRDNPHSGTLHGRLVAVAGFQRFELRRFISGVPNNAHCVARIWGSWTGGFGGKARFAVRDSTGQELSGVDFRLTPQPFYQAYDLPEFLAPDDDVFDIEVTLQGPGTSNTVADIDDLAFECTW